MRNNKPIETRILVRISRMKSSVILREDFIDLGGYDQVGRALRQLVQKGRILKIGYGLYAKGIKHYLQVLKLLSTFATANTSSVGI